MKTKTVVYAECDVCGKEDVVTYRAYETRPPIGWKTLVVGGTRKGRGKKASHLLLAHFSLCEECGQKLLDTLSEMGLKAKEVRA